MPLADPREILQRPVAGRYAVPAFDFHSLDTIPALVEVAEKERVPVILQASPGTIDFRVPNHRGDAYRGGAPGPHSHRLAPG